MTISSNNSIDYSYLFSSLNSSSSSSSSSSNSLYDLTMSIDFSELKSIKSGAYKNALDSYYSSESSSVSLSDTSFSFSDTTTATDTSDVDSAVLTSLKEIQSATTSMTESADLLLETGYGSLFEETNLTITAEDGTTSTTRGYDMDSILSEVSSFVNSYNSLLEDNITTDSTFLNEQMEQLTDLVSTYSSKLENVGITINEDDQTLSIDADKFKSSDIDELKSLFNDTQSFGYQVSAKSTFVNYLAERELSKTSSYDATGSYDSTFSTGNLYSTWS